MVADFKEDPKHSPLIRKMVDDARAKADQEAYDLADRMGLVPNVQLLHAEPLAPGELAAAYDTASDARAAFLLASEAFQELLPRYRRREEEPT